MHAVLFELRVNKLIIKNNNRPNTSGPIRIKCNKINRSVKKSCMITII